jgi:predicted peptidase
MRFLSALLAAVGLTASARAADLDKLLETHVFTQGKASLPYRLMKPADYDGTKAYPLVIFLHGAGERGRDNKAQLVHGIRDFASDEARKKHPCFLLVPQCPPEPRRWVEVDWSARSHTMPKEPSEPARLVLAVIDQLRKDHRIDEKRIYLTGLSMGGYGTWDLIARRPDLFAAGLPVCGGGDPATAEKLAKVPIWAFHGDKDTVVRPERSREMIAAIEKAGGKPKYTEYKGVGHDSWTRTYANKEVLDWLFAQKK